MSKLAAVRIRGRINVTRKIRDTLNFLNLKRRYTCTVVEDTPSYRGMLQKVKDMITYGEIDDKTYEKLKKQRGIKTEDGLKPFFRLNPPRKGFARKGTKVPYAKGGASGYRGKEINKLLERMI